jgi:hypothetical protein
MEKEFIPYEEALALKELGFNEPCLLIMQYSSGSDYFTKEKYSNSIWLGNGEEAKIGNKKIKYKFPKHSKEKYIELRIPLYQQVFRWFRKEHNLFSYVGRCMGIVKESYFVEIYTLQECLGIYDKDEEQIIFNSSEEAELACLRKLIEICKK